MAPFHSLPRREACGKPAPLSLTALCAPLQITSVNALYVRRPRELVRCHVIQFALKYALFFMKHLLRTDLTPGALDKGLGGAAIAGRR